MCNSFVSLDQNCSCFWEIQLFQLILKGVLLNYGHTMTRGFINFDVILIKVSNDFLLKLWRSSRKKRLDFKIVRVVRQGNRVNYSTILIINSCFVSMM